MDENWNEYSVTEFVFGAHDNVTVNVPFHPPFVYLNKDSRLLNAETGSNSVVKQPTSLSLPYAYFYVNVTQEDDSSLVRVEHYRLPPDPISDAPEKFGYVISPDRYWKVGGIWSSSFQANARIEYNAKNQSSGNLDNGLMQTHNGITFTEDSLVLLWRPNERESWKEFPDNTYEIYIGSSTDGKGVVMISELKKGEYALGFQLSTASVATQKAKNPLMIYPNPTADKLTLTWKGNNTPKTVEIIDEKGSVVAIKTMKGTTDTLSTKALQKGRYTLKIYTENGKTITHSFLKN